MSLVYFISCAVLAASGGPSISLEAATALDTDGSGKVELNEIVAFARSHGLDVNAVQNEFASFDRDQDGTLDIAELNATLGSGDTTSANAEKVTLRTRSQTNPNEVASQTETKPQSLSQPNANEAASQMDTKPQSLQSPSQSMIKVHNQNALPQNPAPPVQGPAPTATGGIQGSQPATSAIQGSQPSTSVTSSPTVQTVPAAAADSGAADATAAQSMIKALDTDGSGVVEKAEVDAFAKSQGLSAAETAEEFKDLDKNHDGQLDSSEISSTVAQYTSTAAPVPVAAATNPAKTVPAVPVPTAVQKVPEIVGPTVTPAKSAAAAAEPGTAPAAASREASSTPSLATDPEEIVKTLAQNTAQADRTVAQLFALKASNDLAKRDKDVEEAKTLEQKAAALRGQAQKVAADAIESAEQAAQKVGRSIMEKALDEATNLENQAKKVEGRAASINAKAKVAMSQAMKAQSSASQAVEDLVTSSAIDAKEKI
jgi:Ca2+-binding EF-hand superfamily protein